MNKDIVTKFNCFVELHKPCIAFVFGSHIYQTNSPTSDVDCVFVIKDELFENYEKRIQDFDIHFYCLGEFIEKKMNSCDIQFLEGLSIKDSELFYMDNVGAKVLDSFKKDLVTMRHSISSICSNSFVKAKKKLTVEADYDKLVSMKSLFHSIRMYDFGLQFAKNDKIIDFQSCNNLYREIQKDYEDGTTSELIELINNKYKLLFNSHATEFKKYCPKK